ncbi:hypothetical protein K0H71_21890 [Bacillus sp. IITD106]|nr:hypothetical protein [Bacillus sp. IITD106]
MTKVIAFCHSRKRSKVEKVKNIIEVIVAALASISNINRPRYLNKSLVL